MEIWTTLLILKEGIFAGGRIRPGILAEKRALQTFQARPIIKLKGQVCFAFPDLSLIIRFLFRQLRHEIAEKKVILFKTKNTGSLD